MRAATACATVTQHVCCTTSTCTSRAQHTCHPDPESCAKIPQNNPWATNMLTRKDSLQCPPNLFKVWHTQPNSRLRPGRCRCTRLQLTPHCQPMPPAPPATEAELSRMLLLAAATELCILQGRWKAACPVDTEAQMAVLGGCAAAAGDDSRHCGTGACDGVAGESES